MAEEAAQEMQADMRSGMLMRRRREELDWDLPDVASVLKINARYLGAIESGDMSKFPSIGFLIPYVRSYARHLGMDPDDVVRRFKEEIDEISGQPSFMFPAPKAEGQRPHLWLILFALALLIGIYGFWSWLSTLPIPGARSSTDASPPAVACVIEVDDRELFATGPESAAGGVSSRSLRAAPG